MHYRSPPVTADEFVIEPGVFGGKKLLVAGLDVYYHVISGRRSRRNLSDFERSLSAGTKSASGVEGNSSGTSRAYRKLFHYSGRRHILFNNSAAIDLRDQAPSRLGMSNGSRRTEVPATAAFIPRAPAAL